MDRTQRTKLIVTAGALALVCGACVSIGGCAGRSARTPVSSNEPVNTGLIAMENDGGMTLPADDELMSRDGAFGSVSDQIAESARQLDVYFANIDIDGVEEIDPSTRRRVELEGSRVAQRVDQAPAEAVAHIVVEEPTKGSMETPVDDADGVRVSLLSGSGNDEGADDGPGEEPTDLPVVEKIEVVKAPSQDPLVRKEELARELAEILRALALTSDDPGSAALALAGLETLLPDDTDSLVDEGVLSDGERASLDAARSFLRSMSSEGSIASPSEVSARLDDIQAQLNSWAGLTIKKSALCTRVDGYGRYETFPSYRFIAGRSQAAIVYVELERFGQREFVGPDGQARFETKLSQRLELYHVADDLNTWNRAAETVIDVTRNHLRDYYLINQITLPANLGVGRYHLKVVMRDLIEDKVAESIIAIEIVAR